MIRSTNRANASRPAYQPAPRRQAADSGARAAPLCSLRHWASLPVFLGLCFLVASCASRTVITARDNKKVTAVAVPATQRPYRINGRTYYPLPSSHGYNETGIASWYGGKFHGRKTSNGETYNMYGQTAAHKTLPMNTHLLVKNLENGREITVRVNDRGPFVKGRIIDLSLKTARDLGMASNGTAKVQITALGEALPYTKGAQTAKRFLAARDFEAGDFYVQIGAFVNRANAVRLKNKIAGQGRKTVIRMHDRGDTVFYRVQVWAGNTRSGAGKTEQDLIEAGYPNTFVVAR